MGTKQVLTMTGSRVHPMAYADTLGVGAGIIATGAGADINLQLTAKGTGSVEVVSPLLLDGDVAVGTGAVKIGSSVTDYLEALWVPALAGANAAVNLGAHAVNTAGAYGIGVDTAAFTQSAADDLQTVLANFDTVIAGLSAPDTLELSGQTTTGCAAGDAAYVSAANTWTKTDSKTAAPSLLGGVVLSSGVVATFGYVAAAKFSTAAGEPANGQEFYVASQDEDGAGAPGAFTKTCPSNAVSGAGAGVYITAGGIVLDKTNWTAAKTCAILLRPQTPIGPLN